MTVAVADGVVDADAEARVETVENGKSNAHDPKQIDMK